MDEKEGTQAIFGQQGATCAEMGEMPNWPTNANAIQQNTNYPYRWQKHAKAQFLGDSSRTKHDEATKLKAAKLIVL